MRRSILISLTAAALALAGPARAEAPGTPAQACDQATASGFYTLELRQQCLDDFADSQDAVAMLEP